jgi:arginase
MDQTLSLVGVPMDLGADRRGVDMGPSAIRYGGLADQLERIDRTCHDDGDLPVPRPEEREPESTELGGPAKYLDDIRVVCERLADRVGAIRADDQVPLVLGGDHSIAIGTAAGLAEERSTGVLWLDAHGDFNTPATTPSGNVHGMALAALLGAGPFADCDWTAAPGIDAANVALVGLRDLDNGEKQHIRESDVSAYTMTDIDERGISAVVREALEVATADVDQLYLSLDLDALDPAEAPGVGTPVRGGLSYREAHTAMEFVHDAALPLCALDLVEVNPILDRHNQTAELACELAASALGDRIL